MLEQTVNCHYCGKKFHCRKRQLAKLKKECNYLIGREFRQRIESMDDTFREMKADLESERVAIEKI